MQTLLLVRGLPNSHQKNFALYMLKRTTENLVACSVDEMFNTVNHIGQDRQPHMKYEFNPRLLGAAHDLCYGRAMQALNSGHDVVVTNPFSTRRELARYTTGAKRAFPQVAVRVIHVTSGPGDGSCYGYERGDIPPKVIKNLATKWEAWQGEVYARYLAGEWQYELETDSVGPAVRV